METLTYFQGLMLSAIKDAGEVTSADICRLMSGKLDKSVQHQHSTVINQLHEVFEKGYLECFEQFRGEGDFRIQVKVYRLSDLGLAYVRGGNSIQV